MITTEQLAKVYGRSPLSLAPFMPHLLAALTEWRIDSPKRVAAFVAQIGHESGSFRYLTEIADGSAYEGRKDLGNVEHGDGHRFKGRGVIQITGRANYKRYGDVICVDLVNFPERAADPENAFRLAGAYWHDHKLNDFADCGEFDKITRAINGGLNGKADRDRLYARALEVLGA